MANGSSIVVLEISVVRWTSRYFDIYIYISIYIYIYWWTFGIADTW